MPNQPARSNSLPPVVGDHGVRQGNATRAVHSGKNGQEKTGRCSPPRTPCSEFIRSSLLLPALPLHCLLLVSLLAGCQGYQIGSRSFHRPDIRTVYVPMFESDSFRRHLGERLAEAVVKQIEQDTPYKVVSDPGADSVLRGRLIADSKAVLAEDINDNPRDLQFNTVAQFQWTDRLGNPIIQTVTLPIPPGPASASAHGEYVPEAGQSTTTASQTAIDRLAREIVSQLQSAW